MKRSFLFIIGIIFMVQMPVAACDPSGHALARCGLKEQDHLKKWFFDFTFEQQDWNEMDAREAHLLHHQGHHFHDKSHEEFYHFALGLNPVESVTLLASLPYVERSSIEVDNHRTLGRRESSSGLGDLNLTGTWRFLDHDAGFLGVIVGIKFPTGAAREETSVGVRFEPELQPGTGSYDYSAGAAFQHDWQRIRVHGNVLYTLKTEGDQDFEFGDLLSSYLIIDTPITSNTRLGLDLNLQIEDKQIDSGVKVVDSGGVTLLLGPAISVDANDSISLFGNFLMPVYQDLGGVHQKLDFVWNGGVKIRW